MYNNCMSPSSSKTGIPTKPISVYSGVLWDVCADIWHQSHHSTIVNWKYIQTSLNSTPHTKDLKNINTLQMCTNVKNLSGWRVLLYVMICHDIQFNTLSWYCWCCMIFVSLPRVRDDTGGILWQETLSFLSLPDWNPEFPCGMLYSSRIVVCIPSLTVLYGSRTSAGSSRPSRIWETVDVVN